MSTTLDALWSIQELSERTGVSQSTEFVARRGGRGFKLTFFYGPVWLLILAGLGGWYYRYRKGNPEKAKRVEEKLREASASVAQRLKSSMNEKRWSGETPMLPHSGRQKVNPRAVYSADNGAAHPRQTERFNPPPNWPVPSSGWVPDEDWRPDPSWPPAPPGWQFWVA